MQSGEIDRPAKGLHAKIYTVQFSCFITSPFATTIVTEHVGRIGSRDCSKSRWKMGWNLENQDLLLGIFNRVQTENEWKQSRGH